ncbi:HAD family hydrolase [Phaeacidiphilus oryzae]|uniref:HAD family hydrolase n=1 Tax=Phaeacidiphilus oryzae TaxID=348818 RepID=UPI00068F3C53|nr:HAD-IA family hydrolase [Phaeacidiphilus oryzae]
MSRMLFPTPTENHPGEEALAAPVPPIEAVLFDFSNTLFRMIPVEEWVRRIAERTGRRGVLDAPGAPDAIADRVAEAMALPEVAAAQVGRDSSRERHRAAMEALFSRVEFLAGAEEAAYQELCAPDAWVPYPDTEPVLRALRERGLPVGIVSDFGWDLRTHLRRFGLDGLIGSVVLSCDLGREKPDPQLFLKACAELGADPRRSLMVGDNPVRDGGANAVGLRAYILAGEQRTGERGLAEVLRLVG